MFSTKVFCPIMITKEEQFHIKNYQKLEPVTLACARSKIENQSLCLSMF